MELYEFLCVLIDFFMDLLYGFYGSLWISMFFDVYGFLWSFVLEMWIALGAFQLKRRRNPFDGT